MGKTPDDRPRGPSAYPPGLLRLWGGVGWVVGHGAARKVGVRGPESHPWAVAQPAETYVGHRNNQVAENAAGGLPRGPQAC